MDEDRRAALDSVEDLIAAAACLLVPLCGQHTTIGILQQIAEEQTTLADRRSQIDARDRALCLRQH